MTFSKRFYIQIFLEVRYYTKLYVYFSIVISVKYKLKKFSKL